MFDQDRVNKLINEVDQKIIEGFLRHKRLKNKAYIVMVAIYFLCVALICSFFDLNCVIFFVLGFVFAPVIGWCSYAFLNYISKE